MTHKRGLGRPFRKGQSGNPGGRPTGYAEFRALMRSHSPAAGAVLIREAEAGERWAVELLLAYAWGKPAALAEGDDGTPVAPRVVVSFGSGPAETR